MGTEDSDGTTRVNFNAPESLVDTADQLAELLGLSRTDLLVAGLRQEVERRLQGEGVRRVVAEAYYRGELDTETVRRLYGSEEAARMRRLREALDREPPAPDEVDLVPAEAFYDGDVPEWTPEDDEDVLAGEAALAAAEAATPEGGESGDDGG